MRHFFYREQFGTIKIFDGPDTRKYNCIATFAANNDGCFDIFQKGIRANGDTLQDEHGEFLIRPPEEMEA